MKRLTNIILLCIITLISVFTFSAYTTNAVTAVGGVGTLDLSRSEAFLSGDSIVVTLIDNDLNTTSGMDSATVNVISSSDDTGGSGTDIAMSENASNSGTFLGTFATDSSSDDTASPPKVRAVSNGMITVEYQDADPPADITAEVSTKNFGAVIDITEDTVELDGNAVVSLFDMETNSSISSQNLVNVNVTSTIDSSGTTLRLEETGNDTGSFLGTIAVSSSSTLVNTRIQAAVGDTVTVSFTDNPDANGGISIVEDTAEVVESGAVDSQAPSGSITINEGDSYTNSTSVTLNLSATDDSGVTGYYLSEDSSTPSASSSGWTLISSTTSYDDSISYSLSSGEGLKTIYVWYKDSAENVSSTYNDSITLDTTSPSVTINSPTSSTTYETTDSTIDLGGTASDNTSGINSVTWSNSRGGSGTASGTTSWSVSGVSLSGGDNTITVTAMDNAGNTATDSITVTLNQANPPTVTTGSAANITDDSATLSGTANANNESATVWFEYGLNSDTYSYTSSTQTISGSADTSISIAISGLSEGTEYYYRIVAENSAGTGYGDEKNFTTELTCTDDYEPNDDFDEAYGPLESGKSYEGKLCSSEDKDYFKFEVENQDIRSQSISIQLTLTVPTDNDYDLYLYDPSENKIGNSVNAKGTETISYSGFDEEGMYYIQVSGYGGSYDTENTYILTGTWTASTAPSPTATPTTMPTTSVPVPSPTETPVKKGIVIGTVVNALSFRPIAEATVSAVSTDSNQYATTTNPAGRYVIPNIQTGDYTLTASAGGFQSSSLSVMVYPGPPTVVNFSLTSLIPVPTRTSGFCEVYGDVTDEDGKELPDVTVNIEGEDFSDSTATGENGYFEFTGLASGEYTVAFEKEGYKGSSDEIDLKAAEERDMGIIVLKYTSSGRIYGTVTDTEEIPIEDAKLKLKSEGKINGEKIKKKVFTGDTGTFEFTELDAGTYKLKVKKSGYERSKTTITLDGGEEKEVGIVLEEEKEEEEYIDFSGTWEGSYTTSLGGAY